VDDLRVDSKLSLTQAEQALGKRLDVLSDMLAVEPANESSKISEPSSARLAKEPEQARPNPVKELYSRISDLEDRISKLSSAALTSG